MSVSGTTALQLFQDEFSQNHNLTAMASFNGKKRAAMNVLLVALALGPERARSELMPLITDYVVASREEDEILYHFSLQLNLKFAKALGGGNFSVLMLPALEFLANFEETCVRDEAMKSMIAIIGELTPGSVTEHFVPMAKRLGEGEWFTGRISAVAVVPPIFSKCDPTDQDALFEMIGKLTIDETPMVRNKIAESIGHLVRECAPELQKRPSLTEHIVSWFRTLTQDAQKSVRLTMIQNTSSVCKVLSDSEVSASVIPLLKQFVSERSYRVRLIISGDIYTVLSAKPSLHESIVPLVVELLQDSEEEVRCNAIVHVAKAYKSVGRSVFIPKILPTLKALGEMEGETPISIRQALVNTSLTLVAEDPDGAFKDAFKGMWDAYLLDTTSHGHAEVRRLIIEGLSNIIKCLGNDFVTSGGGWGRLMKDLFESSKSFARSNNALGEPQQPSEMEEVDTPKWRTRVAIVHILDILARGAPSTSTTSSTSSVRLSLGVKRPSTVENGRDFAIDIWKSAIVDEANHVRIAAAEVLKEFVKPGSGMGGVTIVEQIFVPFLKDLHSKGKSSSFQNRIAFLRCCAAMKDTPSIWSKLEDDFCGLLEHDPVVNVRLAAVRLAITIPQIRHKLGSLTGKESDPEIKSLLRKV